MKRILGFLLILTMLCAFGTGFAQEEAPAEEEQAAEVAVEEAAEMSAEEFSAPAEETASELPAEEAVEEPVAEPAEAETPAGDLITADGASEEPAEETDAEPITDGEVYSGTCGTDVTWSLDTETGVLTISGEGEMENYLNEDGNRAPWYLYKGCITSIIIGFGVVSIGDWSFSGCSNMSSISIPGSVLIIGNSAFSDCSGLTGVSIPDSVISIGYSAFFNCSGLTGITIPESVTYIGNSAFMYCSHLINVILPEGITNIGSCTFWLCRKLTSVTIPVSVTEIGYGAFYGCSNLSHIDIPDGVTSIGNNAFDGCSSVTRLSISDSVVAIGDYAFEDCYNLASVTIPNSVISIGSYAFNGCTCLTNVYISESVISIGDYAFKSCSGNLTIYCGASSGTSEWSDSWTNKTVYCSVSASDYTYLKTIDKNAESIIVPDGVNVIPDRFFYNCSNLTSVTIPESVTTIRSEAFFGCEGLTDVSVGSGVGYIGEDAFYGCSSLTNIYISDIAKWCGILFKDACSNPMAYARNLYVKGNLITTLVIPDGVTSIGDEVFMNCASLISVTIPDSVISIGDDAFYNCNNLTDIVIPDSIAVIGRCAFQYCRNLTDVIIPDGVTSIGIYAFEGCYNLTNITISGSITAIGECMFAGCTRLVSVSIPDSVTSIGSEAFYNCSSLAKVYYNGSEDDRAAMTIGSDNDCLTNAEWRSFCTVTYDANGGTGAPGAQTKYNGETLTLSSDIPTRMGYTFSGWSASSAAAEATYQSGGSYTVNGNVTLYAVWEDAAQVLASCRAYTAKITAAGGEAYYKFTPSSARTYLVTAGENVKITLCDADDNVLASGTGRLSYPMAANTTYRIVIGYADGAASGDITFVFGRVYTIRYSANGGTGAPAAQTKDYGSSLTLTEKVPVRPGYSFLGWAAGSKAAAADYAPGAVYSGNSNTTLYAVWAYNTQQISAIGRYTANIKNAGGTVYYEYTPTGDKTYVLYTASKNAEIALYDAEGNVLVSGGRRAAYAMTAGQTYLFAVSLSDSTAAGSVKVTFGRVYTVRYKANGGTGAPAAQEHDYGTALTLSKTIPTRNGYSFLGWSASSSAKTANYEAGEAYTANGNVTLYAVWEKNP